MEHIHDIVDEIKKRLPDVRTRVEKVEGPRGPVWVDVSNGRSGVVIEWRQGMGYGVTSLPSDSIGTASDETYEAASEVVDRVEQLLNKGLRTQPPQEAALQRLREHRRVSQDELARRLGVSQPSVSRMEHRLDMNISTLRSVVEAIGGTLEIVARFADEAVRITQFDEPEPDQPVRRKVKRSTSAPLQIHKSIKRPGSFVRAK